MFGVFAPGQPAAQLTYFGLYALQHRGQESAGIATADGQRVLVYKDMGLVANVFAESHLAVLKGHVAIGHTRYSTSGSSVWENAQPTIRATDRGSVAMAHNGNLVNTADLAKAAVQAGVAGPTAHDADLPLATNDTGLITALLAASSAASWEQAALQVLPTLRGAFSLTFLDEHRLYAARDPQGVRPLVLGQVEYGWVVASETAALDIVGARLVREVDPGELLVIDAAPPGWLDELEPGAPLPGVRSVRFAPAQPKGCLFEYVYLARPDTSISGRNVYATRIEIGRRLAAVQPVEADLVIPVPESGTPAAIGYAQASGIDYSMGLVKNAYVGRTFIQPTQLHRRRGIRLKLNPLREVVAGKRLVVVDDSIVRGNTQRALVAMLREAGAREVHVRIASAPVRWPCYYGVDFATREELIAASSSAEQIRQDIGADTLAYVKVEDMVAASQQPRSNLCLACFDGQYPIALPQRTPVTQTLLDHKHTGEALVAAGVQAPHPDQQRLPLGQEHLFDTADGVGDTASEAEAEPEHLVIRLPDAQVPLGAR